MIRRQFITHCLGGVAAVSIGLLSAACAPSSPPQTGPTSAGPAGTPKRGGTVTWAVWDKIDDIDPATLSGAAALEVVNNILDPLIAMDADQKFYPALATKWSVENEARKFSFTLRDDVKFHDGAALDSSAVKRTFERILDPATKAAGIVPLLGPIDKIETPDPRTVVVTLKDSYPPFLLQIWRPYFRYPVTQVPGLAQAGRQGVCSGWLGSVQVQQPFGGWSHQPRRQPRLCVGSGDAEEPHSAVRANAEVPLHHRRLNTRGDSRIR